MVMTRLWHGSHPSAGIEQLKTSIYTQTVLQTPFWHRSHGFWSNTVRLGTHLGIKCRPTQCAQGLI